MSEAEVARVIPLHVVTPPKKVPKPKSAAERKARIGHILEELDKLFPQATCALQHKNAWQLLVATILSAQCTDERVNRVTRDLFRKYRSAADYAGAAQRRPEVQRAAARFRWTGSWHTVFVTADRAGGGPVDAPFDLTTDMTWVGYANDALRSSIEPVLQRVLRRRGYLK